MAIVARDGVDGKVCSNCKEWQPVSEFSRQVFSKDGYQSWCKACMRENSRRHYNNNREKMQQYRDNNREQRNEQMRAYREADPEDMRRRDRERYHNNREKILNQRRQYYQSHREEVQERHQKWWNANPDKVRASHQRRRARKQAAEGSFTDAEWAALKARHNYTCLCCGKSEPEILLTVDHIIPLEKGGSNYLSNIQPLCQSCNRAKWTKIIAFRPGSGNGCAIPLLLLFAISALMVVLLWSTGTT